MLNIGGARPGESDMALLGHPEIYLLPSRGRRAFTAVADASRPSFQPEDSVVTVIGAEAPHSVIYSADADNPEDAQKLLQVLAIGVANMGTNNAVLTGGGAAIVLNPEHAEIARANMMR